MALNVDASFEDGVFVPARRPTLVEGERVRLTIEPFTASVDEAKSVSPAERSNGKASPTDRDLALALDFHADGC
jgi:predicted DNA-binding antitoxin AbrB/MazE fold protein